MRAVVIDGFGGPEKLREMEMPTPWPGPDEVLIRLAATSVNPVDWKIREGLLVTLFPHHFPLIPGWDAAGTIEALGERVQGFAPGDKVFAYCRKPEVQWGTYAEYVTMRADAVAPMPASLSFVEAACLPLVGLTAWQALFEAASLKAGQTILIHAGAGGVGGLAIQLAKHAGARVLTTASAANHDYVRGLGADHVIDYAREDFVQATRAVAPEGVDVVFATVGGETLQQSYAALRHGGFMVSIVDAPVEAVSAKRKVLQAFVFVSPNGGQLRRIARLIEAGRVRPPAIEELTLGDAAEAQIRSKAGHVRGKIALRIA